MELTRKEKFQVQYLLPIQGSLKTLEQVEEILKRINITAEDAGSNEIVEIQFSDEEINFICDMIKVLDQAQKLNLEILPLIRKFLLRSKKNG
jgi:hypothetical protein